MNALLAHIHSQRDKVREAWQTGFVAGCLLGIMVAVPVTVAATIAIVRM